MDSPLIAALEIENAKRFVRGRRRIFWTTVVIVAAMVGLATVVVYLIVSQL